MTATLFTGLLLGGVVSGVAYRIWGTQAAFAAAVFAGIATLIQLGALRLMQPARAAGAPTPAAAPAPAPIQRFLARWGLGMGLRFLGVVALALAAGLDPGHFPALPTAMGFLGVLLPLLFFEVRLIR